MALTKNELEYLRSYRDKTKVDCDDIKVKEQIKSKLLNNKYIVHVLNNTELDEDCPDEYFGINILPYYMITPTQIDVQNFICYEVQYDEINRYNNRVKNLQIIFYILCDQKNIIDKDTYLARHDLLAALIMDEFNWKNYFGSKIHCIEDKPSVVDTDYACRTLVFEQTTDNNLTKTRDGIPRTVNKEIHT